MLATTAGDGGPSPLINVWWSIFLIIFSLHPSPLLSVAMETAGEMRWPLLVSFVTFHQTHVSFSSFLCPVVFHISTLHLPSPILLNLHCSHYKTPLKICFFDTTISTYFVMVKVEQSWIHGASRPSQTAKGVSPCWFLSPLSISNSEMS
jgi:hypothetical protein